ncbi:REV1, DNA directed polymerase S homeolog [Xenopus laevis]|uniref:DNA repair protein REV1 n=1 Tax=Xenopus laevis TaxID=8355 RepID=Q6NRK6_XENLA|nr:REV1, DNA directed polymerase S homeolog [Xenopus laevis]AAH70743.1 MGC83743 protein [Xenopus laevis]
MRQGGWRNRASEKDGWTAWGGYIAAKVQKLDEQFRTDAPLQQQKDGTSSKIFNGVSIYVNGYTDPTADQLRHLMMLHGGQYHVYYSRSKTTHIIATNLPNNKVNELKDEKVVRPEWITESIKAGRLLSYVPFQLYTKKSSVQKGLNFTSICKRDDSLPGPSNISRDFSQRENSTIKDFSARPISVLLNGVERLEEDEHKNGDFEMLDLEQIFSDHKPNGLQKHIGNTDVCSKHIPSSNGALKSLDSTVHFNSSFESGLDLLQQQEKPDQCCANITDCTVEYLQPNSRQTDVSCNPHRTVPLPSSSCLHTNSKINGANHSLLGPSSTNALSPAKLHSPQLPKTADPNFISDFYSHSRLHHISTWKCEFTEFVRNLQTQSNRGFPGRERLKKLKPGNLPPSAFPKCQNCIIHVDMDCFFVSVAIRNHADLKGKPVAVTSNRGAGTTITREGSNPQLEFQYYQNRILKGKAGQPMSATSDSAQQNGLDQDISHLSMAEIASCSYEARQAGVKNGMFFGRAKQLCPELQAVPYDFDAYKEVAMNMYKILASYTHDIEAVSCDEALADITGILTETRLTPDEASNAIRTEIKEKTGCAASIGIGSNILLARMATRRAKPDGQYHLKPEEVDDFIRGQLVNNLPGVGRTMDCKLSSLGVKTCGELQNITMAKLQKEFGPKTGQMLYRFCRGLDDRPIRKEKERKSVSAEINYGIRFTQTSEAEVFLMNLSEEIQRRLEVVGMKGKKLTLKIMVRKAGAPIESAKYGGHGICDNIARTVTLHQATASAKVIGKEAVDMFHTMKLNISDMRGVGLQVHQLIPVGGLSIFGSTLVKSGHLPGGSRSLMDMFQGQKMKSFSEDNDGKRDTITAVDEIGFASGTCYSIPPYNKSSQAPSTSKAASTGQKNGFSSPNNVKSGLRFAIEVPSPSQIDPSVLEALPSDIREQVEQTFGFQQKTLLTESKNDPAQKGSSELKQQPVATVLLQIPNLSDQGEEQGINVIALPAFSQVDPEVFAALPADLQEELRAAYGQRNKQTNNININPTFVSKNPLLQLRKPLEKSKKRSRKKNKGSPTKNIHSPLKPKLFSSPLKNGFSAGSPQKLKDGPLKQEAKPSGQSQVELGPSTSNDAKSLAQSHSSFKPKPPNLAGAIEFSDVKTLLREWITTISDPMEEDILQVVRYCTDLIDEKDLEKLDLVIKYMKRLMQQSVESVWNMAFDFILDNIQVVLQQTYGSTLKVV